MPNLQPEIEIHTLNVSLRDWFAGMAMQGLASDSELNAPASEFAKTAYEMADAMLQTRKEQDDER